MKLRTYGLAALIAVGVVPITAASMLISRQAERTATDELRRSSEREAARLAAQLGAYVDSQVSLLESLGTALTPGATLSTAQLRQVLKGYRLQFPHLISLDLVVPTGCHELATSRLDDTLKSRCDDPAVTHVRNTGTVYLSHVALRDLRPVMTYGVPLSIAGSPVGVAVAEVDMVQIWEVLRAMRVGRSGHARVVSREGTLIGHGDVEERRRVFLESTDPYVAELRASGAIRAVYRDSQGREVVASSAEVPAVGWTVVVEEPLADAFAGVRRMKLVLLFTTASALLAAILVGLLVGHGPVRAIETLRSRMAELAKGDLSPRPALTRSNVNELLDLGAGLEDMARDLSKHERERDSRERLNTFAKVAAGLAHDLKNPILAVRVGCERALRAGTLDEASKAIVTVTTRDLPKLHQYVDDMHRLAQGGLLPVQLRELSPDVVVARVLDDARANPAFAGVTWRREGGITRFVADESRLERGIHNLVWNAAEACLMRRPPGGEVVVTLSVVPSIACDELAITVSDTGIGMTSDRLAEVLVHDFKSDKRATGVGLGLAVVRQAIDAHGGRLVARSELGVGSTFVCFVPSRRSSTPRGDAVVATDG